MSLIAICGGLLSIMDGCGAMLKSIYSFKATYSAALTFREGDIFLELDASKSDRYIIYMQDDCYSLLH